MKIDGERYLPPGMSFKAQGMTLLIGLIASLGYSLRFFADYYEQYQVFRFYESGYTTERIFIMNRDADIDTFMTILGPALNGFYMLAFVMLLFSFWNWIYFYQESRSIYLMRRIRRKELYIRIWTLPVLTSLAALGLAGIIFLIYWGIYYGLTPERYIR